MVVFRAKWGACLVLLLSTSVQGIGRGFGEFLGFKGWYGHDESEMVHEWPHWKDNAMATFYQQDECKGERGVYTHPKGGEICDRRCYPLNGAASALLIYEHALVRVFPTGDCSGDELEFSQPKGRKGVCVTWGEAAYSFQMIRSYLCRFEWQMNRVKVPIRPWWKYWPAVEDESGEIDDNDGDDDGDTSKKKNKSPMPINVEENSRKAAEMLEGATRRIGDGPNLDAEWREP